MDVKDIQKKAKMHRMKKNNKIAKTYDYYNAVESDVKEAILNGDYDWAIEECTDIDDVYEKLNDEMWVDDSITGNGSGSYTFNSAKSRQNIQGNEDLLVEVLEEYGGDWKRAFTDPEYCDVSIRCWLLGQSIWEVLNNDAQVQEYVNNLIDTDVDKTKKSTKKNAKPIKKYIKKGKIAKPLAKKKSKVSKSNADLENEILKKGSVIPIGVLSREELEKINKSLDKNLK